LEEKTMSVENKSVLLLLDAPPEQTVNFILIPRDPKQKLADDCIITQEEIDRLLLPRSKAAVKEAPT
jgi:hypothetical protein